MSMENPESYRPMEASAREIADTVFSRSGGQLVRKLFPDQITLIKEMLTDAAHDGVEFGESIAGLPTDGPSGLEHYWRGYTHAIDDLQGKDQ